MKATLHFLDENARTRRMVDKTFKDRSHLNNYIKYIKKTKDWSLDEMFTDENEDTKLIKRPCIGYKKSKHDSICTNCNCNKSTH
jgi:hypothetical protein